MAAGMAGTMVRARGDALVDVRSAAATGHVQAMQRTVPSYMCMEGCLLAPCQFLLHVRYIYLLGCLFAGLSAGR
jgi:hypothetical protein